MTAVDIQNLSRLFISAIGSFWTEAYSGAHEVKGLTNATADGFRRTDDLVNRITPFLGAATAEPFDRRDWYTLDFLRSDRSRYILYNAGIDYDDGYVYGQNNLTRVEYPIPAAIVSIGQILSRRTQPAAWLFEGQDYVVDKKRHTITFVQDPLTDTRFSSAFHQDDIRVQGYDVKSDADYCYNYVGYYTGYKERYDSARYCQFAKTLVPLLVDGPTAGRFDTALAEAAQAPIAKHTGERVLDVARDYFGRVVITDQEAYRLAENHTPDVSVGDTLFLGQPLCQELVIHEFNRGTLPDDCDFLTMGAEVFGGHYREGLTFQNVDLPTYAETISGTVRLRFQVDGLSDLVTRFWADVTAAEDRLGRTFLEYLLDRDDPPLESVPPTINPAAFIAQHLLRWGSVRILSHVTSDNPHQARRLSTVLELGSAAARFIATLVAPDLTDRTTANAVDSIDGGAAAVTLTDSVVPPTDHTGRPTGTELC